MTLCSVWFAEKVPNLHTGGGYIYDKPELVLSIGCFKNLQNQLCCLHSDGNAIIRQEKGGNAIFHVENIKQFIRGFKPSSGKIDPGEAPGKSIIETAEKWMPRGQEKFSRGFLRSIPYFEAENLRGIFSETGSNKPSREFTELPIFYLGQVAFFLHKIHFSGERKIRSRCWKKNFFLISISEGWILYQIGGSHRGAGLLIKGFPSGCFRAFLADALLRRNCFHL